MSAHTPGPWTLRLDRCPDTGSTHFKIENPTHDGPCPCGGKHPPGVLIAWLAGSIQQNHRLADQDRIEADARLIAAAPDLLRRLVTRVKDCTCVGDSDFGNQDNCLECIGDLKLIAEAEGR